MSNDGDSLPIERVSRNNPAAGSAFQNERLFAVHGKCSR